VLIGDNSVIEDWFARNIRSLSTFDFCQWIMKNLFTLLEENKGV